ncbi:MAG: hypothetical protein DRQ10_05795 [Candidatus Hydrothermota bacterium]|nr:MAG: hypothetical protein DRQ10_05795 [Candidatus Hydrothermae bacterium]
MPILHIHRPDSDTMPTALWSRYPDKLLRGTPIIQLAIPIPNRNKWLIAELLDDHLLDAYIASRPPTDTEWHRLPDSYRQFADLLLQYFFIHDGFARQARSAYEDLCDRDIDQDPIADLPDPRPGLHNHLSEDPPTTVKAITNFLHAIFEDFGYTAKVDVKPDKVIVHIPDLRSEHRSEIEMLYLPYLAHALQLPVYLES